MQWDFDVPSAFVGLGLTYGRSGVQVDVFPFEFENLTNSPSSHHGKCDEAPPPGSRCHVGDAVREFGKLACIVNCSEVLGSDISRELGILLQKK